MKTTIKRIDGNWNLGFALDKHTVASIPIGENAYGHMQYNTIRTDVGEALFQLKYRGDWSKVNVLASTLAEVLYPRFQNVGIVIPMPASTFRPRQPVTEIANALSIITKQPCFHNLLLKSPNGPSLKNLNTKVEKAEALQGTLSFNASAIENEGKWNALLVDDVYHTGASIEAACHVLRGYAKVEKIYVAALTWK